MSHLRSLFVAAAAALVLAACSGEDEPIASLANFVDTVDVGALIGTPVSVPSAYSVAESSPVRTDQGSFDFAFDIDAQGQPVFLPLGALGLAGGGARPGLQRRPESFDAIVSARSNGYLTDVPVPIAVGEVYMIRSRVVCSIGVPLYGKLEVLDIDAAERMVTFRVLTNNNCGFTGLAPGIPEN